LSAVQISRIEAKKEIARRGVFLARMISITKGNEMPGRLA